MPNVGGVQYPYTPQGIAAAQQAQSPPLTSPSHPMAQRQTQDLQPYPLSSQGRNQNALAYSMGTPSYYIPDDPSSGIRGMRYGNPLGMSPSSPWYGSVMASRPIPGQPSISRQPQTLEWSGSNFTNDPFDPAGSQPTRNMLPPGQRPTPDLQPYYNDLIKNQQRIEAYGHTRQPSSDSIYRRHGVGSASAPWAVGPIAQAPRGQVNANYGQSPSNPNWKPAE